MPSVILICGKICAGKTTYARALQAQRAAVLLSVDEIMLTALGPYAGERHDEIAAAVRRYLFAKSLEVLRAGADVLLDWGFWTKAGRAEASAFYKGHGVPFQWHYLSVSDEAWQARVLARNRAVAAGETAAYPVDDGLAAKLQAAFEAPAKEEMDVWIESDR